MKLDTIDVVFSFDTTGSMYPCLTQVRRYIVETVTLLFRLIPNLRIGVIAHGDYCDQTNMYRALELTDDQRQIINFVNGVPATGGGDMDEAYEYVLHRARGMKWTAGRQKALVMIGDCCPHAKGFRHEAGGQVEYDWLNEAELLIESGIKIYPVQAMGRSSCTHFYQRLADLACTPKLDLPQFADLPDILTGIVFHQAGQLDQFERELTRRQVTVGERPVSAHTLRTLAQLSGKPLSKRSASVGSRFQVIDVDSDCSIREFVEMNGLEFEKGRGFYEFTKPETIQNYKEVIAQNAESGAIITGKRARGVLGIPADTARVKPDKEANHVGFVQSTSVNRRLKAGTKFLYEVKETADIS